MELNLAIYSLEDMLWLQYHHQLDVVWAGGSGYVDTIQYVNITTEGDAVDFGRFNRRQRISSGCSNAHGGL